MMMREKINTDSRLEYKANPQGGFSHRLVENKTQIWTHDKNVVEWMNPFFQCLNYAVHGKKDFPDVIKTKYPHLPRLAIPLKVDLPTQHVIALHIYDVQIDYYIDKPCPQGRCISYDFTLGMDPTQPNRDRNKIALLRMSNYTKGGGEETYYCLLLPSRHHQLELLRSMRFCEMCTAWKRTGTWREHVSSCRKCEKCGCAYKEGDGHSQICNRPSYNKKKRAPKTECRKYKQEGKKFKMKFEEHYFADFECFVPEKERDFTVYAAAYCNGANKYTTNLYYGKKSLDHFMNSLIEKCAGILWFFNGSRFDNFFLLKWLLSHQIEMDNASLLINGNNILCLKFKTEKGWLVLKDLSRFLNGSLAANCKAFKVDEDKAKTDFDHLKMVSWDAVMKYEEECTRYLRLDVISLKEVYIKFSSTMYDLYKINIANFMTISQVAYAAWTSELKDDVKLFKTTKEEEVTARECYRGGRVLCGRKEWRSKQFQSVLDNREDHVVIGKDEQGNPWPYLDGEKISREIYDTIDDYLVYADVNSLYPAAQVNCIYPYGKHETHHFDKDSNEEKEWLDNFHFLGEKKTKEELKALKKIIWTSQFCIDVTCPDDLTVGFLMSRKTTTNSKGEQVDVSGVVQDLLPKTNAWYCGPEIWEAVKLGYMITRIHTHRFWEAGDEIFNSFVLKTYELKKAQTSDGPIRACAKTLLNALTGKFGQKNVPKNAVIFRPGTKVDKDLVGITMITDEKGDCCAFYGLERREMEFTPYPVELSSFILCHARRYMSKFLRRMDIARGRWTQLENGERFQDFMESLFYSDTDSLIIHIHSWFRLDDKWKGDKELGQLKLEIDGKIIGFTCLANKTYNIIYIDAKTLRINAITKTKGIPHKGGDNPMGYYNAFDFYTVDAEAEYKAQKQSAFLDKRRNKLYPSHVFTPNSSDIKHRAYIFREILHTVDKKGQPIEQKGKILHVCSKIPPSFLPHILHRRWTMECIFGGMVRKLGVGGLEEIYIAPETKSRTLCLTDWWGKEDASRFESELDKGIEFPTSYPIGHYKLK